MQTNIDVLVIDDSDTEARDTILGVRRARQDLSVTRLKDGETALEFVLRQGLFKDRPDVLPRLLFLELDIPKTHGLEVLTQLRRVETTREIPVVAFTRNHNPLAIEEAYAAGASAYLVKPAHRNEYLSEVTRLVTRWLQ